MITLPCVAAGRGSDSRMAARPGASSWAPSIPPGYISRGGGSPCHWQRRSRRPPFSNSAFASARFLIPLRIVPMTSGSSIGLEVSIDARWRIDASAVRSASAVAASPFLHGGDDVGSQLLIEGGHAHIRRRKQIFCNPRASASAVVLLCTPVLGAMVWARDVRPRDHLQGGRGTAGATGGTLLLPVRSARRRLPQVAGAGHRGHARGEFHFDGRFFPSVRYLFSRPGFLTCEFIAGAASATPTRWVLCLCELPVLRGER